jgi:hypothetical protein
VSVTVTAPQILWSGILDPTRAVDWSIAGAGTIPNRTTLCQTLNPGATATQINSAIAGCSNGVVLLSAGTYNLTSPISILHSNVTLRGAGADQTFLKFTGNMQSACDNAGGDICIYNGNGWYAGGPGMTANWTGSSGVSGAYSQGATQITLDNTTGLQVGSQLILDQLGDNADTGNIYQGQNNTSQTASTCDACNNPGRPGRPQTQTVQVQNISGSGPYTVTITPPLYMPNWRSSQSPGAWWGNGNLPITESGIENLSVDSSGVQNGGGIITLAGTTKCWVKGVRTLFEADSHIKLWYGNLFNTIRDNYMYGSQCHGGTCSQSYGINTYTGSANLFENNICDSVATCFQLEDHQGSVYGYNYAINEINPPNPGWMLGHLSAHAPGNMYLLWEGNQVTSSILDDFHGPADFITEFRNRISGWQPGIPTYYQQIPLINQAWSRYTQAIGNVFGTAGIQTRYTSIEGDGSDGDESCQHSIYAMGWGGNCGNSLQPPADGQGCSPSNTCPWPDPLVATTFLRWGNWDTFNGSPQWNPSEVPSGLSIYANPVPASQTLPSSFYLSGKPAWWPSTIHFPPIGPDVSGGDIPNLSGHAYNIPAEACWKNTIFDPAYVTTTPNVTATWSAGIATVNMSAVPAAILPAAAFTVTGMNPSGYNCNNCVILSNSATTISYAVTNDPGGSGSGGTIYLANDPIGSGSLALAFNADTCYGTSGSSSLSIKTTSLPNGTTSATYGQTLSATGGTPPYSWSIVSGTLPAGLALTGISGALSGTPTTAGTFNFTVQVQDIASPTPATATQLFSITISSISSGSQPLPLTLPIPDLSGIDGKIFSLTDQISFSYPVSGVTFQWQFNAINGNPSIEMTGAPAGAPYRSNGSASIPTSAPRFTPASANLTPGTYTLTVTVTQGNQSQSATATITLAPSDLSSVKVYPNPWRSDKHAGKSVTFANLPIGSTVKLFTVSGHLVKTVIPNLDTATWDLTNDSGDKVASGIYLYVITDGQGNKTKGKVAVIK